MDRKIYEMKNPEIFRKNSFNRCRICGQYLEQDEKYLFVCGNNGKQYDTKYMVENCYLHIKCLNNWFDMSMITVNHIITDDDLLNFAFSKPYPRAKNKLTNLQKHKIEILKANCKKKKYYFTEKTKYIEIEGKEGRINIAGKYNKIEMRFEAKEKGFNLLWLLQSGYLDSLLLEDEKNEQKQ